MFALLVDLAVRLTARADEADMARRRGALDMDAQVGRWPLRMTEFLRDRLRRRWLRLRRPEP